MLPRQKCCLHCPGNWKLSQNHKDHICYPPISIKDPSKLSSLKRYVPSEVERSERCRGSAGKSLPSRQNSVDDRFAIAKKFHAENLQHQPLPDKVDDSVFRNVRPGRGHFSKSTPDLTRDINLSNYRGPKRNAHKLRAGLQYGPTLGCKTPTTNMDLAICWEAPIDPTYEPPWPVHIDGSDGGPGPAIFALVQHENENEKVYKTPVERFEAKFTNVKGRCRCERVFPRGNHLCNRRNSQEFEFCSDEQGAEEIGDDLCANFESVSISETNKRIKSGALMNPRRRQPVHLRNCETCVCKGDRTKRPRSRSIHSAPVIYQGTRNFRRNGLPTKINVPRPRTPYAKRDFCIDTLTPPFNIVEGCRDADYPEHWRLTSVYQQSFRNPRRDT